MTEKNISIVLAVKLIILFWLRRNIFFSGRRHATLRRMPMRSRRGRRGSYRARRKRKRPDESKQQTLD